MKKTSTLLTDFDKNFILISGSLITLLLLFLYKSQCSYYINEYILNKLGLEFCDDIEISYKFILLWLLINIFNKAIFRRNLSDIDYEKGIVFSILFGVWIYTWTSPFSEGKNISYVLKRNNNRYDYINYDFTPNNNTYLIKSKRSSVDPLLPASLEEHIQFENYIFFSKDSIFLEKTIGLKEIELKFQIKDKYIIDNNKIDFDLDSKNIFFKLKDSNEYYLLSNIKNIKNFSFLNQFPSLTKEDKEKIKKEILNNYLFQKTGKVSFYINQVNNRTFDCYVYNQNKELFHTRFIERT